MGSQRRTEPEKEREKKIQRQTETDRYGQRQRHRKYVCVSYTKMGRNGIRGGVEIKDRLGTKYISSYKYGC